MREWVCVWGISFIIRTKLPQLLDMWLLAFLVLAFCSSGHANTVKVYFQSENFHNVLHWDKYDSPDNQSLFYSVEYNLYGTNFEPKNGCQDITALSCDLTEETPASGPDDQYIAQVKVGGRIIGHTKRFTPFMESELGAPDVAWTFNAPVMTVRVKPPKGPNNKSVGEILDRPLFYTIILTHNESGEAITQVHANESELFDISKLHRDTEYCGSVTYSLNRVQRRPQSKAFTFCTTLPEHEESRQFLFLLAFGAVLLLLVPILLFVWRLLIWRKGAKPESLNFVGITSTPLTSEKTNISKIEIQPEEFTIVDVVMLDKKTGSTTKHEGYAPQDTDAQPWHCHTYNTQQMPPPEDSQGSALSSPTYSVVVRVDVHNSSEDESSPTSKRPDFSLFPVTDPLLAPGSDLDGHQRGAAAEGDPESPQPGPLRLQISPDGTLQLPFLRHPPRTIGDHDPREEISEQTALLPVQPEAGGLGEQPLFHPSLSSLKVWDPYPLQKEEPEACATNTYISNEVITSPQGTTSYLPVWVSPAKEEHQGDGEEEEEQFCPGPLAGTSQETTSYLPVQEQFCPGPLASTSQETTSQETTSYLPVWVNPAEEEHHRDGEEEEKEEKACNGDFLKAWMLQIQSSG